MLKQNPYDLKTPNIFAEERTNTNRYSNSFFIRIVSRLGTNLSQPYGIFVLFLSLKGTATVNKVNYCLTKISIRSSVNFPADFVCLWNPVQGDKRDIPLE